MALQHTKESHKQVTVAKIIILLLVCILVDGCLGTAPTLTPPSPAPAMTEKPVAAPTKTPAPAVTPTTSSVTAEEYAVYEAIIEWGFLTESTKLVVIDDHTAAGLFIEQSLDEQMIQYIRDNMGAALEAETLNDYLTKNEQVYRLEKRFPLDVRYILISAAGISSTRPNPIHRAT